MGSGMASQRRRCGFQGVFELSMIPLHHTVGLRVVGGDGLGAGASSTGKPLASVKSGLPP